MNPASDSALGYDAIWIVPRVFNQVSQEDVVILCALLQLGQALVELSAISPQCPGHCDGRGSDDPYDAEADAGVAVDMGGCLFNTGHEYSQ